MSIGIKVIKNAIGGKKFNIKLLRTIIVDERLQLKKDVGELEKESKEMLELQNILNDLEKTCES